MNTYAVTLPSYRVIEGEPITIETVMVQSDYFRLEGGHLVFRNNPRGNNGYPETHRVFPPGMWTEVELCR